MSSHPVLSQLKDELKLQAWLARAELRNPSVHQEVSALAQARDELRVQAHLGQMELGEEWGKAESSWEKVKVQAEAAADSAAEELGGLLTDIRAAYDRLRA